LAASSCFGKYATKTRRPCFSYRVFLKSFPSKKKQRKKKKEAFPSRSVILYDFAYWIQANKDSLHQKRNNKLNIFYGQPGILSFLKMSFHP